MKRKTEGSLVLEYYVDESKKNLKGELDLSGNVELMVVPDYGRGYAFVFCVVNTSRRMFLAAELQ